MSPSTPDFGSHDGLESFALSKPLAVWSAIMAIESVHGAFRRLVFEPIFGEQPARAIGVLVGSVFVFAVTWFTIRWLDVPTVRRQLGVGVLWALLTFGAEFALGLALGYSTDRIASDYDLIHGGLMPLGLLAMALSPLAAAHLRRRERPPRF